MHKQAPAPCVHCQP